MKDFDIENVKLIWNANNVNSTYLILKIYWMQILNQKKGSDNGNVNINEFVNDSFIEYIPIFLYIFDIEAFMHQCNFYIFNIKMIWIM